MSGGRGEAKASLPLLPLLPKACTTGAQPSVGGFVTVLPARWGLLWEPDEREGKTHTQMTPGQLTVRETPTTASQRLADLVTMLDDLEALHGQGSWIDLERRRVEGVRRSVAKHGDRLTPPFATVLADIESVVLWRLLALADWVLETNVCVERHTVT